MYKGRCIEVERTLTTKQQHPSGSKGDSMHVRHVVLEMHDTIENQPLGLTPRMATSWLLTCGHLVQVSALDVIHHL
jgi:hypothetical protein